MVSVIVPNYNHAFFLEERINSVLKQTYQDFEVILLDDNSTDHSWNIIEGYKHHSKVVHINRNQSNSGSPFYQWNKGINLAKGEWIWIAESDDFCETTLLETLISNALKDKEVVLSYCQSYEVDETGGVLRDMTWWTNDLSETKWNFDYINSGLDEVTNFLLYKNTIPNASAIIFRKSAFLKVKKSFERMKLCGDWLLWMQLLRTGKIAYSSKPLNYFRKHSATTRVMDSAAKKKLRIEEELKILHDIRSFLSKDERWGYYFRKNELFKSYQPYFKTKDIYNLILNLNNYKYYLPYKRLLYKYVVERLALN